MRRTLLALGLAVAGLARGAGQPRLVVGEPVYDFGAVTPDHPVSHRFILSNAGGSELILGDPRPTCTCTTVTAPEFHLLAPGQSTWVEVTFDPTRVRGVVDRIVEVPSDDPAAPVQQIYFKVDVLNGVRSSREDLYFHGLDGTGRVRDGIVLSPDGPEPARLLSRPISPVPWLAVTSREDGERTRVDFTLDLRRLPAGRRSGTETVPVLVATRIPTVVRIRIHWDLRETGPDPAGSVARPASMGALRP